MPSGRSDAGLECLSVYRVSTVQRMRTPSRAPHVVSTIIFWGSECFGAAGNFGANLSEFFVAQRRDDIVANRYGGAIGGLYRVGALQPAHDSYPPAQQCYCRRRASFPRLVKSLVPECLRDLIVAGRGRKSSATFGTLDVSRFVSRQIERKALRAHGQSRCRNPLPGPPPQRNHARTTTDISPALRRAAGLTVTSTS
jgi:hypothetical protein